MYLECNSVSCAYTAYMYELIRVNSQIKVTGENVPTFAAKFELPSVKQLPEMFKHQNFASKGCEISPCILFSTNKEWGLKLYFQQGWSQRSKADLFEKICKFYEDCKPAIYK